MFPMPPLGLMERVGKPASMYDAIGAACRRDVLAMCPPSFRWEGARVLDFGCGAGRTLRQFGTEADVADEFWGCDIHDESVAWAEANLCPPFRVFRNDTSPPLPLADASLDLVYAFSVFTHLADTWSAWLLDLHRVLKPGGVLIATFLGRGGHAELGRPWDEDRIGMLVTLPDETFDDSSGPVIFHSEWWIREHWGRAFEVIDHRPWAHGPDGIAAEPIGHGCVALRRREVAISTEDLERPADDAREWAARAENVAVVARREGAWRDRALRAEAELTAVRGSRRWRLAQSFAKAGRLVARRRGPA